MDTTRTVAALRQTIHHWRAQGKSVALVPTMGALHAGHLALVAEAKRHADAVITSIFVNPTQFAPHEDFDRYPRTEDADYALLNDAGADAVYLPTRSEIYPEGSSTRIRVERNSTILEGQFRPHFFDGVATVVGILFMQTMPDVAIFGEKDYQQLCIIRQLVADLSLPIRIIGLPTVREDDGLALSSRNRYLTPEERVIAPQLHTILARTAARLYEGENPHRVLTDAKGAIHKAGFRKLDYLEWRDATTLLPANTAENSRLLVAAWLGNTRLIDNIPVIGTV